MPEEQARDIVDNIIDLLMGGGPHSGQNLDTRSRQPTLVAGDRGGGGAEAEEGRGQRPRKRGDPYREGECDDHS